MVIPFRICSGAAAPALLRNRVFVEPNEAETIRLLIVMTTAALVVTESMVTVLVVALVIVSAESASDGAAPLDQLVLVSHLPLRALVQVFVVTVGGTGMRTNAW